MIRFLSLLFILCSCTSNWVGMGESAASQMHVPFYIAFQHEGKRDTAAMFFWRGQWWMYHSDIKSVPIPFTDPTQIPKAAALLVQGASSPITIEKTPANVPWQPLYNGCLPDAIIACQKDGGGIEIKHDHATRIP